MIVELKKNTDELLQIFNLTTEHFAEDAKSFNLNNHNFVLTDAFEEDAFLQCIKPFKNSITIFFRYLTSNQISGDYDSEDEEIFKEWIQDNKNQPIILSVTLNKSILLSELQANSNLLIFFNPTAFNQYIKIDKFTTEICMNDQHTFIYFPYWSFKNISNHFVTLIGNNAVANEQIEPTASSIVGELKDRNVSQSLYCNAKYPINCLPNHFHFKTNIIDDPHKIFEQFRNTLFYTVMNFISNVSEENQFIIQGYKNIKIKITPNLSVSVRAAYLMFQIYETIYSSQIQDKLLITRNVISLHLKTENSDSDFIDNLLDIFYSIDTNYDSFIKDKIKSYFDKKKDLEKHVRDTSETISKQIAGVSDNLNKSWLALGGAILAAVVTYSSKGGSTISGLFFLIFGIVSFITIKYTVWLSLKEMDLLKRSFKNFLKQIDGINEVDKKKITGTIINDKFILLNEAIKKLTTFKWIIIICAIIISFSLYIIPKYDKTNINSKLEQQIK